MNSVSEFFVRKHRPKPGTCFVLMPFNEAMTQVYEHGIKPCVESIGMQCRRADEIYSAQGILGDIWDSIQSAEIVIADLTEKNPNVMYELGLCHTLWKRVILLSQNKDDVPFDLRAWRVIWYDFSFPGAQRLREELQRAIASLKTEGNVECKLVPLTAEPIKPPPSPSPSHTSSHTSQETTGGWLPGLIDAWKPNERYGFIEADGESFYFNHSYLFSTTMEVAQGLEVIFVPQAPLPDTRNRRASRVFVVGSKLIGRVTRVPPGKGFGFADVVGDNKEEVHSLFILIDSGMSLSPGERIEFTVDFNDRGPIGKNVVSIA